jgi:hypothetical protein
MPDRHLLTRAAFIKDLQQHAPIAWPAIWGSAYAHIEACLEAASAELERLLEVPEMHRTRLRMEMRQVLRLIAEEGPEGPARWRERAGRKAGATGERSAPVKGEGAIIRPVWGGPAFVAVEILF